jgi:hypothetical protein
MPACTGAAPTPAQIAALEALTDKFIQLAYQEPRIVAVIPFIAFGFDGFHGTVDIPTVLAKYKRFGKSVLTNVALNKAVTGVASGPYPAINLTDGNVGTLTYPNDYSFEYLVDLDAPQLLHRVELDVAQFGAITPVYITSWSLYGMNPAGAESLIASGGTPGGPTINIHLNGPYTRLRVQASSTQNWIGIYELRAFGEPVPATVISVTTPAGPLSAVGVPITWSVSASASTPGASIEYLYGVYNATTSAWVSQGAWVPQNTFTYTPSAAGLYHMQVLVRVAGSAVPFDDWRNSAQITVSVINATISAFTHTAGASSPVGTPITFTPTASAFGLPIEYLFMLYRHGFGWVHIGTFGPQHTFTTTPGVPGLYHVQVLVRVKGKAVSFDDWRNSIQINVP